MVLSFTIKSTKFIIDIGNENLVVFLLMSTLILHLFVLKQTRKRTIKFANYETLKKALGYEILKSNWLVFLLRSMIVFSLILALYKFNIQVIKPVGDVDFVIALDISQTMLNSDNGAFLPNKLEVAKKTTKEIISLLPERTRVGIVTFSGKAFVEQPLSSNKEILYKAIDKIESKPPAGTVIGDALVASTILLANSTKEKKSILLITDGKQTEGLGVDINDSIEYVKRNNIIVNTIGLGKKNISAMNLSGINVTQLNIPEEIKREIMKMENKTINISELDEETLKYIANMTGGKYYHVLNETSLKEGFVDAILRFNAVTIDARKYALLVGVILLLIEYLLGATKYKTIP